MSTTLFERIVIVGPGLIGGSLGLALRARGLADCITGVGHRQVSLDKALAVGAIDVDGLDAAAAVADADLVVLAVSVGKIMAQMGVIIPHLQPGALLTDVGSIKAAICNTARDLLAGESNAGRVP